MRSIGDRFSARKSSPSTLTLTREVFIEGGLIRKLWSFETNAYRDHLLRLDPESRRNRFNATIVPMRTKPAWVGPTGGNPPCVGGGTGGSPFLRPTQDARETAYRKRNEWLANAWRRR